MGGLEITPYNNGMPSIPPDGNPVRKKNIELRKDGRLILRNPDGSAEVYRITLFKKDGSKTYLDEVENWQSAAGKADALYQELFGQEEMKSKYSDLDGAMITKTETKDSAEKQLLEHNKQIQSLFESVSDVFKQILVASDNKKKNEEEEKSSPDPLAKTAATVKLTKRNPSMALHLRAKTSEEDEEDDLLLTRLGSPTPAEEARLNRDVKRMGPTAHRRRSRAKHSSQLSDDVDTFYRSPLRDLGRLRSLPPRSLPPLSSLDDDDIHIEEVSSDGS